ncbi:amino acid-binding protein [Vallicoccus soli]|uniref:Amino acid-binding protein n=1 Tax=Vallicoccus soli TaxID=2339232 RepID=A0A3A3Z6J5_9ACTN|nr:amino acid-binding protein [Vallicoccus soli]RJK97547.1 amino acid-binding protein [Vallicoccus soli]
MLARLRVSVPDRPGSLGLLTSAVGGASGDIVRLEVLESGSGRALDDLFVEVRDGAHLDRVAERVAAVRGVSVEGLQRTAPPVSGHAELELAAAVVARPEDALRTAVDMLPGSVGADWAALLRWGTDGAAVAVLGASTGCPGLAADDVTGALRLRPLTGPWGEGALLPVEAGALGLLVVRTGGPAFHRSELWRLGQLGEVVGSAARLRGAPVA